jgi:hypothetical protein
MNDLNRTRPKALAAVVALCALATTLSSCKNSPGSSLAAAAAHCECQQLLPVGDRPNYPRVAQPFTGTQCGYLPQMTNIDGGLTVSVHRVATRLAYDDVTQDVLAGYPKVRLERDLLVSGGGVAAVATAPNEIISVTWVEADGRAIVTKERVPNAENKALSVPAYLPPLVSLAPANCVKN